MASLKALVNGSGVGSIVAEVMGRVVASVEVTGPPRGVAL